MTNLRNLIVLVLLGLFLLVCDASEDVGSLRASMSVENAAEMEENSLQSVNSGVENGPVGERRLINFWALFMARKLNHCWLVVISAELSLLTFCSALFE